jgi:hypothetical protein
VRRSTPATPGLAKRLSAGPAGPSAALARAGFADPVVAAEVLREVQVLALTPALAGLDYASPRPAQAAIASLITARPRPQNPKIMHNGWRGAERPGQATVNGVSPPAQHVASSSRSPPRAGRDDGVLAGAASRIVADARQQGEKLSQADLADRLRALSPAMASRHLRRRDPERRHPPLFHRPGLHRAAEHRRANRITHRHPRGWRLRRRPRQPHRQPCLHRHESGPTHAAPGMDHDLAS